MSLFDQEKFHSVRRLQIKALRLLNEGFLGAYRSAFKGRGLEFEEVREYQSGDEMRSIDWNVTARASRLFVKNFQEERELTLMLVVDLSFSTYFSHTEQSRRDMIAEIGALIAFCAIKNSDKVGLLIFSDEVELYLKPKKGVPHALRVVRELLSFQPKSPKTDIRQALAFLGRVQKKRAICFLLSDFLTQPFKKEIGILSLRHEWIAFHLVDSYEQCFEPQALFHLIDIETGESTWTDTSDKEAGQIFEKKALEERLVVKETIEKSSGSYFRIHTEERVDEALHRFFRRRGKHR